MDLVEWLEGGGVTDIVVDLPQPEASVVYRFVGGAGRSAVSTIWQEPTHLRAVRDFAEKIL